MGKQARRKRERRAAEVVRQDRSPRRVSTWVVVLATVVLVLIVGGIVGGLLATRSSSKAPPPAASGPDKHAPASLVKAANEIGFAPNIEQGTGQIETQPASAGPAPTNPDLLADGTKAPPFTLKTPLGKTVSLADYRGKAVLLEFFATWCPHCAAEVPFIRDGVFSQLSPKRYAWLSVNADGETAPSVYAYDRYFGLGERYPSLLDPSSQPGDFHSPGAAGPVTLKYGVQSFPTFYVVDPKGKITWSGDGEQPNALLLQELRKAAGA